jgi:hypothetical protein
MEEFIKGQAPQQAPAAPEMIPQGAPQGAGIGVVEENPLTAEEEPASEEEQAQFDDLQMRALGAIHDIRKSPTTDKSLADATIEMLSTKDKEPHVSIGTTAGLLMVNLIDNAKRNEVEYSGPVIQEVGMVVVQELYEVAKESGAITGLPEEDTPEMIDLMELAALEAAKVFGEWQIQTGQADQQGHMQDLQRQMQREAEMEEFDPAMRMKAVKQFGGVTDGS